MLFVTLVFEHSGPGMEIKIKTKVSIHKFKRIVDCNKYTSDTPSVVSLGIHFIHLTECRI